MQPDSARRFATALVLLGLLSAACTRPGGGPSGPEGGASPSDPTARPATVDLTPQTPASAQGQCVDEARFLEDLSVPDGTVVEPGESVDKRWSVRNTGTCDWGPGYRLVPLGENPLAGVGEVALYPAKAGAEAIWRVTFEAPAEAGEYLGQWQAASPSGGRFGESVFSLLVVAEEADPATATPSNQ